MASTGNTTLGLEVAGKLDSVLAKKAGQEEAGPWSAKGWRFLEPKIERTWRNFQSIYNQSRERNESR
jgi:hypothetical protein